MKQLILLTFLLAALAAKSQTGYTFAYGVNTNNKNLCISAVINITAYTNCEDETTHAKLSVKNCLSNSFINMLKIETGSTYYRYEVTVACKTANEYFTTKEEADRKRKEIMAGYAEMNYTIKNMDL